MKRDPKIRPKVGGLFKRHVKVRQAADIAAIGRGKETGELAADTNPELLINSTSGSLI